MSPRFIIAFCSVLIVCLFARSARLHAVDYTIDSALPATSTNFHSLEDLRDYLVTYTLSLYNNDTISLYQDDDSLTENFDITLADGESITVKSGDGTAYTITQDSSSQPGAENGGIFHFGHTTSETVTLNLDGIVFADNAISGGLAGSKGGIVYSAGNLIINIVDENGVAEFTNNSTTGTSTSYTGAGGTIYSESTLTFKNGTYIFSENTAVASGSGSDNGIGGAIGAYKDLHFQNGNYTFQNNTARNGGAIYVAGEGVSYGDGLHESNYDLVFHDGNYVFSENTANSHGGAIHTDAALFKDGTYNFSGNQANSGGVIYAYNGVRFDDGTYVFSENSAAEGGVIRTNLGKIYFNDGEYHFLNNTSTLSAGAIYGINEIIFRDGEYEFSGNQAFNGRGGAIYSLNYGVRFLGGKYVFDENSAIGGTGNNTGIGGAIYSGLFYASSATSVVDTVFTGNKAVRTDVSNLTTGRGGAIFVDQKYTGTAWDPFNLTATTGNTVLFQGNMHGDENAMTPNSIYFGATQGSYTTQVTTNATFNAQGNGQILMYDPIESQGADFDDYDLLLNLNKTGTGLWLLGGTSNLDSRANVTIDEGRLRLYGNGTLGNAHLNLNNATLADLTFKSASTFSPTIMGDTSVSTLTTGNITVEAGATLDLVGVSTLSAGDHRFVDAIKASGTASIDAGFVYTPIAGNMFDIAYYDPNNTFANHDLVIMNVKDISDVFDTDPFIDDYRKEDLSDEEREIFDEVYETGSTDPLKKIPDLEQYLSKLKGSEILDILNMRRTDAMILRNLLFDRMGCDRRRDLSHKHSLWGIITQDWAKMGDTTYKPFVFTFGSDRHVGRWTLGVAGQYSNGKVQTTGRVNMRSSSDALTLGLYANRCGRKYYARGMMQFGVGWNDVSTLYTSSGVQTGGSFENAILGTSFEFGRMLRLGNARDPWMLTPHAGVDYFHIHGNAFTEYGSSNTRSFGNVRYNVAELPFGVRLAKTIPTYGGSMNWYRPTLDVTYAHSVGDGVPKTTAHYTNNLSSHWQATGTKIGRDVLRVNVGVDGRFWNRLETGLSYQLESRNRYSSHQLNASATWRW